MMASSSGAFKEGTQQGHSSVSPYNGSSVSGEWGVPTFQHQQTISMEWTPEEQTMLEEGLAKRKKSPREGKMISMQGKVKKESGSHM